MIGPQVTRDGPGVAALVEARIFKADRERADIPRRLDFAERGGDARGIDASGEKDADRHVRAPVARHRVAQLGPESLGRRLEVELIGMRIGGSQYLHKCGTQPASQQRACPRGSFCSDRQIE